MNYFSKTLAIVAVILVSAMYATAKDAPTSATELASRLELAVKAKNKSAALELFDWEGVSADMKTQQQAPVDILFDEIGQGLELSSVNVGRLPSGFPTEQVLGGKKYHSNLPVEGAIHVMLAEDVNPTEFVFAYGKKDKSFFLSALVETKVSKN